MPREGRPPYFPFYVNDFVADRDVEAMTTEAVGAYLLLLCKAWFEEPAGTIPNDDVILARWARLTDDRWSGCKSQVLAAFRLDKDGGRYRQKRLALEFSRLRKQAKAKSEAGKAGAESRWHSHASANAPALANDGSSSSSSSSSSLHTHPTRPKAGVGLGEVRSVLEAIDRNAIPDARSLHDAAEAAMRAAGFETHREFPVEDRGDGRRGFVDLFCTRDTDGVEVGIELDRASPRAKSIRKLGAVSGLRVIVLRELRDWSGGPPAGVDAVIALGSTDAPPARATSQDKRAATAAAVLENLRARRSA